MEGVKVEFIDPETGQVVPHWDEAKNIAYNNTNTPFESETVQDVIGEILNFLGSVGIRNITDSGDVYVVLSPNTYYRFTQPLSSLRLELQQGSTTELNKYMGKFVADEGFELMLSSDISYANSTITFTEGNTYIFYIVDNVISFITANSDNENVTSINLVTTSIGHGTYAEAVATVGDNTTFLFQWLLEDYDDDSNFVRKMIWHVGDGVFIDAQGSIITDE